MIPTTVIRVTNGPQLVAAVREMLPGYSVVGNEDGGCQILHRACDTLLCVEWPGFPPLAEAAAVAAGHADVCPDRASGPILDEVEPLQVGERPDGACVHCSGAWTDTTVWTGAGPRGWMHIIPDHCRRAR